jgi:hypothetical protein
MLRHVDRIDIMWIAFKAYHPTDPDTIILHLQAQVNSKILCDFSLFFTGQPNILLNVRRLIQVGN